MAEQTLRRAAACDLGERRQEAVHRGGIGQQPFEGLDAGEHEAGCRCDGACERQRRRLIPRAGAPALHADLQQHRQRPRESRPRRAGGQGRDHLRAVGQDEQLEAGIGERGEGGIHRQPPGRLVRPDHTLDAEAARHLQLLQRGHGDAPGALGDLQVPELRRHRRLAMRAEREVVQPAEIAHPGRVAHQRAAPQHGERQRQVAPQQVPALRANLVQAQARHGRDALHGRIQHEARDRLVTRAQRILWRHGRFLLRVLRGGWRPASDPLGPQAPKWGAWRAMAPCRSSIRSRQPCTASPGSSSAKSLTLRAHMKLPKTIMSA